MSPLAISLRFLQTQPDQRLVELARAGHERAFEALVRRHRGALLGYCRRVAPRGAPPEDILQQGLLQAWRALSRGAEVHDARAWLYRIVHNVAITALRGSGELSEELAAEPGAPGAPGVEQLVEQRFAAREALAGLAGLPDLQRQVMVSAAIDGRSHEEIAAALGLSSGSVRGLIYRARSKLRAAAAAVIPAPVIDWAIGDAGGASAGLAGAGSAGLGALIVKGGTVLAVGAVGAVAGTAAIVVGRPSHHPGHVHAAAVRSSQDGGTAPAGSGQPQPRAVGLRLAASAIAPAAGQAPATGRPAGRGSSRGDGSQRADGHDGSGEAQGSRETTEGGGGSGSGGPGSTGSSDGGSRSAGGSTSGSDGGGDRQATTATAGSDGGGGHGTSTTATGTDGGSSGGSSSGGSSSGGSSDGGQLGGPGGGSSTTTTTTTPTTTTIDGH